MTIGAAVAVTLKSVRTRHDLTMDDVATAARAHGATWSSGSIQRFEAGKPQMTIETMIVLAQALTDLTGKPLTLADLLDGARGTLIDLKIGRPVPVEHVVAALKGDPVDLHAHDGSSPKAVASPAEERAAAKLGIAADELQTRAMDLWGRSLEEMSAHEAGEGASPQRRGARTVRLINEMAEYIAQEEEDRQDLHDSLRREIN